MERREGSRENRENRESHAAFIVSEARRGQIEDRGKLEHNGNRRATREAAEQGVGRATEKKLGLLSRFKNRVTVAQWSVSRFELE